MRDEPLRKLGLHVQRRVAVGPRLERGGPLRVVVAEQRLQLAQAHALHAIQIREQQAPRRIRAGMIFEPDAPPQYAEHRLGNELAVVLTETGMRAEEAVQHRVGRLRHRQDMGERGLGRGEVREGGVGLHRVFFGAGLAGGGWQGWPD